LTHNLGIEIRLTRIYAMRNKEYVVYGKIVNQVRTYS